MISRFQKLRLFEAAMKSRLLAGRAPSVAAAQAETLKLLDGRRFGTPFTRLRAAVDSLPIGGADGKDLTRTFTELAADLDLLFSAQIQAASRSVDLYEVFANRRDRTSLRAQQLLLLTKTLLAQQQAGSRASVTESFTSLDLVDLSQTTAHLDLAEGVCTLPPDSQSSIRYDGSKVTLVGADAPPGTLQTGPTFLAPFNPYRTDAWHVSLPVGQKFVARVNVTGADYARGATEEAELNAIRIEPTGPCRVTIEWSPDGFNFRPLSPVADAVIRDRATFHFTPVRVGFLRFTVRHTDALAKLGGGLRPVGIKSIQLMKRGFSQSASLYSVEHRFQEVVHTVVTELDTRLPYGTKIQAYVSQDADGPWLPVTNAPVVFDTRRFLSVPIDSVVEEDPENPATLWIQGISPVDPPLPNTGELDAGIEQIAISAYPFDWKAKGDRLHVPEPDDWSAPYGTVRSGVFVPVGEMSTEVAATSFTSGKTPLAYDGDALTLCLLQGDGSFALQPGYNYRVQAAVWCPTAITLEGQQMGLVNTGGTANAEILPASVFLNGKRVWQGTRSVTSKAGLAAAAYQATLALQQGWNQIEILLQVPADLKAGSAGLGANTVHFYFQPNLFAQNRTSDLGIQNLRAWALPWKRVSEFDLRYNLPRGVRAAWAWKTDVENGLVTDLLLNHDPNNSRDRTTAHASYLTIDGTLAGVPVSLSLNYPSERRASELDSSADPRTLFFRADLSQDPGAEAPPELRSYRLIVN